MLFSSGFTLSTEVPVNRLDALLGSVVSFASGAEGGVPAANSFFAFSA